MKKPVLLIASLIASSVLILPQQQNEASKRAEKQNTAKPSLEISVITVVFKRDDSLPVPPMKKGVWDVPLQCAGDRYFVNVPIPPEFDRTQLNEVSKSRGIVRYSVYSARGLHGIQQISYQPIDSGVLFLVQATSSDRRGKYEVRKPDGSTEERSAFAGERGYYLLKFDRDGIHRNTIEFDKDLIVNRIGMFDSGTYLALAMTRHDHRNHLAIFDTDGKLLRLSDLPATLEKAGQSAARSIQGPMQGVLPWAQFINWRGNILVVPHSNGTVFEVNAGGDIRRITLKLPKDMEVQSFVPSEAHWYVRVGQSESELHHHFYEFDPETGAMLQELRAENVWSDDIACEYDGAFVAFHWEDGKGLISFRGELR